MIVILFHNPPDNIRGLARRYLYEIRANVFAGNLSKRLREKLWTEIEAANVEALMIESANTEQGIQVHSTLAIDTFKDFDGILLHTKQQNIYTYTDIYAKPAPDALLINHMIDVGCIAEAFCKNGCASDTMYHIADLFHIPFNEIVNSVAFLCAVHDIGKTHLIFQNQLADVFEPLDYRLTALGLRQHGDPIRHERYSVRLVAKFLESIGFDADIGEDYASIIAYHHQGKSGKFTDIIPNVPQAITDIQAEIFNIIYNLWPISTNLMDIDNYFCGFANFVLSIMIVSDWIASGSKWQDMPQYPTVQEKAQDFLCQNLLDYQPLKELLFNQNNKPISWFDVFPDFPPNAVQTTAIAAAKDGFDLMIVEAPCGCGKTEAGIAAAAIAGKSKSGMYFAMPTMATAKGMLPRVRVLANKVGIPYNIPELDSSTFLSDDDRDKIDSDLWSAASRHHMLYPIAVGTIDQAIKAVCKYRYSHIGLLGIADKVIVVDEVHAFDAFIQKEIQMLIKYCKMFHCPIILLSATLNTNIKCKLLEAAGCKNVVCSTAYPMVTVAKDRAIYEHTFNINSGVKSFSVKHCDSILDEMYSMACNAGDGCYAFITPTVDDAMTLYTRLKNTDKLENEEIILYHSRDTVAHKETISNKLIKLFGKDCSNRPQKAIIIATSIIEQSLDIDMDYLITALAPLDLLIQRFGRQGRHSDKGTIREHTACAHPITVLIPKKYWALGLIYSKTILQNTENALRNRNSINTIQDVRTLIDMVYNHIDPKDISAEMRAAYHTLSDPVHDAPGSDTTWSDTQYHNFDPIEPNVRETTYPTVQIAIVSQLDEENINLDKIRDIYRNTVVSVGVNKIKSFSQYITSNQIGNVRFYLTSTGVVMSDDNTQHMRLDTDMGLVFEGAHHE